MHYSIRLVSIERIKNNSLREFESIVVTAKTLSIVGAPRRYSIRLFVRSNS